VAQGRILGVHQQCMESQLMSVSPCAQNVFCH